MTPPPAGGSRLHRWLIAALRLPLFWKIVLANAWIIAMAAAGGVLLSPGLAFVEPGLTVVDVAIPLAIAGGAVSVLVNALIVRLALDPVRTLEETAARVKEGDLNVRAPDSPLADPELERLTEAFNEVLDSVAVYRRRLREVAARSVRAEEEERRRVARLLHDDTAQRFAGLLVRLRTVETKGADPEEVEALLAEARDEIATALDVVRGYALGRRPPALDELGLGTAIESYARAVLRRPELDVRVAVEPDRAPIAPEAELALYRILQEAIDNVARHSQAARAELRVARREGRLEAVLEDDGRGFEVEDAIQRESLGLFEMQERAAAVGGRLEIRSVPGRGTRVEASIPLAAPDGDGGANGAV